MQFFVLRDQRQQALFGDGVDLVQQQDDGRIRFFCKVEHELIARIELARYVDDHQQQVAALQRVVDLFHHATVEGVDGLVHAGRVDQNKLPGGPFPFLLDVDDALDAVARGLRLTGDDGELLADERVQQRGFACVGTANDGDESGAECHVRPGPAAS